MLTYVRLLTSMSGPAGAWSTGDVYACDDGTAQRLIERGYAVPLDVGPAPVVIETAEAAPAPEVAAVFPKRKRRG